MDGDTGRRTSETPVIRGGGGMDSASDIHIEDRDETVPRSTSIDKHFEVKDRDAGAEAVNKTTEAFIVVRNECG